MSLAEWQKYLRRSIIKFLYILSFSKKKENTDLLHQQIHGLGIWAVCSLHENTAAMELAHEYEIYFRWLRTGLTSNRIDDLAMRVGFLDFLAA